jgi:predicted site-specific integrase-resolvase
MSTANVNAIEPLLKTSEVAEMLQMHPQIVMKWSKSGYLPSIRLKDRGHIRYERAAILRFLESRQSGYEAIANAK